MKIIYRLIFFLLVIFLLISCGHIDKKGLIVYKKDNKKVCLTEKNGGVLLKVEIKF